MKYTKTFIAGLIIGAMLLSVVTVFADNQAIEIFFNNIKLSINGSPTELKDSAGNAIEPFIYNGTTYAPVRSIAEALGMEVKYNETTNTVELAMKEGAEKMTPDIVMPEEQASTPQPSWKLYKEGNLEFRQHNDGKKYVTPQDVKRELYFDGNDKDMGISFKVDEESRTITFYYKKVVAVSDFPLVYISGNLYLIPLEDYQMVLKPKLLEAIKAE